jgi:hypothetical protein
MPLHHGQIIERILRRQDLSICEVARLISVNRRTMYNWFNIQTLKPEIIYQVGHAINHDFSVEFPDFFKTGDFVLKAKSTLSSNEKLKIWEAEKELIYKGKYLDLLDRYGQLVDKLTHN